MFVNRPIQKKKKNVSGTAPHTESCASIQTDIYALYLNTLFDPQKQTPTIVLSTGQNSKSVSKLVFTPSQPVRLHQGDTGQNM